MARYNSTRCRVECERQRERQRDRCKRDLVLKESARHSFFSPRKLVLSIGTQNPSSRVLAHDPIRSPINSGSHAGWLMGTVFVSTEVYRNYGGTHSTIGKQLLQVNTRYRGYTGWPVDSA